MDQKNPFLSLGILLCLLSGERVPLYLCSTDLRSIHWAPNGPGRVVQGDTPADNCNSPPGACFHPPGTAWGRLGDGVHHEGVHCDRVDREGHGEGVCPQVLLVAFRHCWPVEQIDSSEGVSACTDKELINYSYKCPQPHCMLVIWPLTSHVFERLDFCHYHKTKQPELSLRHDYNLGAFCVLAFKYVTSCAHSNFQEGKQSTEWKLHSLTMHVHITIVMDLSPPLLISGGHSSRFVGPLDADF